MNWFLALGRMVGTATPFTAWLVQLQAEIDSRAIQARLHKLEDPISSLHPDVRSISGEIYSRIKESGATSIELPDDVRERYGRVLAILEASGFIGGRGGLGTARFKLGMHVSDPYYLIYLAGQFEDPRAMDQIVAEVDATRPPIQLLGEPIAARHHVPVPVVKAIFLLYEAKGLGLVSKEKGSARYIPTI